MIRVLDIRQPPVGPAPDPNAASYVPPPRALASDEVSQDASSSDASAPSTAVVSTSDETNRACVAKPPAVCNFVFPKFQTCGKDDPVDDLLESIQAASSAAVGESPDKQFLNDWDLQEAVLGQYLVFDDDSMMEEV